MKNVLHLCALLIITFIMALIYASVQQTYRSGANEPQSQILYDMRDHLQQGKTLTGSFPDSIDLEKSLSVFVETFDKNGNPLQSSGFINGKIPQLPVGVMEHALKNGEHWVTWQPGRKVRLAMGVVHVNASPVAFIAAGRSLRIVEERESQLVKMVCIDWMLCCGVVVVSWIIHAFLHQEVSNSVL